MNSPLTRVAVLGSTGSIGCQTLDVIRAYPQRFKVVGLSAWNNADLLTKQVAEFAPGIVACANPAALRGRIGADVKRGSITDVACADEVDIIISGVVGKEGLEPVMQALLRGKTVAIANKEAMVMAGGLLQEAARKGGGSIRPVDSEHSAIWQCLAGEDVASVKRLVITASGGALRDLPLAEMEAITPERALAHPNWSMGRKITVDSATLFNKGLEVIEARWLFDVPYDRIDVLMHRESIIHSMVEFVDGSFKAQLSSPDMRQPIQYALSYPERLPTPLKPVDFAGMGSLRFEPLDMERYPCLGYALAAGSRGGTYPAALAAADEEAVNAFLTGRLRFLDIPELLSDTLEGHVTTDEISLEAVLAADAWGREFATAWIEAR
ncbi:MAG TPA: 1-deoxy-D-xylulose-5-phosphate reductoisomerase [Dehalococcoidia bacterium]|nr:1-deoxy-D-xylulose-5-phosphate reductoisomerase [Dehalococcoidia bacterium]